jgi:UDP-N-acetylglucosamine 2-epimerase (non-hydrolysing)
VNLPWSPMRPAPVLCVVGARPNYMKMAPIVRALKSKNIPVLLVHTGQHYDAAMNDKLFADLGMPKPDVNLEVGSGTHAVQTAQIMMRFEPVLDTYKPSCVVVVGDVNSTLACSIVANKRNVGVMHVEAGLRSYDRTMPEEINRVLTDQLADVLYTTERSAGKNLEREGIDSGRIEFVGNVMIDSLLSNRKYSPKPTETLKRHGMNAQLITEVSGYGLVTLHRPSNVDSAEALSQILATLREISEKLVLVFPLHPRTKANISRFGLEDAIRADRVIVLPPQGYLEMIGLMADATVVLTDSGGIQEETTALGVPCLTLRENTERPITVEQGTNIITGRDRVAIHSAIDKTLSGDGKQGRIPEYWDGSAAERIVDHLAGWLMTRHVPTAQ